MIRYKTILFCLLCSSMIMAQGIPLIQKQLKRSLSNHKNTADDKAFKLKTELNLSMEQYEQVKTCFVTEKSKIDSLSALPPEVLKDQGFIKAKIMGYKKQTRDNVDAILSPSQKTVRDSLVTMRKAMMQERFKNRKSIGKSINNGK